VVGEVRLGTMAAISMVVVLASLGLVDALDRFGAWPVLPALFPVVPLGIAAIVAIAMRSLDFNDILRGGNIHSSSLGWALGGTALSTVVLVASPVGTALGGIRGLILIATFVIGLALATLLVAPALRAMRATTLAEAFGAKYGAPARTLVAITVVLILLPLLAAETSLAGTVASRMLGLSPQLAEDIILGLVAIGCIAGGMRAAIALAAVLGPVVALAYLVPVAAVSLGETWLPLPWIGLLEPETLTTTTRIPNIVALAFSVSLIVGVAVMPALLFPAWTASSKPPARRNMLFGVAFAAVILLAAPSYAVYGRLAGIDPAIDPLGLVVNFPDRVGLPAMPAVLLIGGLLSAALITIAMALATTATTLGHDIYGGVIERKAPAGRRIFVTRLGMILVVGAILGINRMALGSAAMLAGVSLSIAAASLGPALLIGWRLRTTTQLAVLAAIAVGLWLTVVNVLLARFAPEFSGSYLGMGVVMPTVLGPTGWFGLPVGLSGLIGIGGGLATLLAVSWLPRVHWPLLWLRVRYTARRLKRKFAARTRPVTAPAPASVSAGPEVAAAPPPPAAETPMFGPFPEIKDSGSPDDPRPTLRLSGV
jgi:Na+(H+)/acetate symporter ActP